MSSALWCVLNGRAMAPPGIGCIIGVSTSRKPRASRNARIRWTSGARVELDAAGAVHEVREGRLAVVAHGHHSAGEADGAQRGQLGLGRLLQPRGELARPVRDRVAAAERIDATAAKRLQLLLALAD